MSGKQTVHSLEPKSAWLCVRTPDSTVKALPVFKHGCLKFRRSLVSKPCFPNLLPHSYDTDGSFLCADRRNQNMKAKAQISPFERKIENNMLDGGGSSHSAHLGCNAGGTSVTPFQMRFEGGKSKLSWTNQW